MTVIGLTGPSGSGKTELCKIAKQLGCECINADEVYHSLLIPPSRCLDEIVKNFGRGILSSDNSLDRSALGKIVFSSKEKLELLNTITHKYVKDEFRRIIDEMKKNNVSVVIVDAPTLFESGFDKECDLNVSLLADIKLRKQRIINRDELSAEKANARLSAQKEEEFFIERSDHIIRNDGSLENLRQKLTEMLAIRGIVQKPEDK